MHERLLLSEILSFQHKAQAYPSQQTAEILYENLVRKSLFSLLREREKKLCKTNKQKNTTVVDSF